ncbi:hypothetical protein VTI28DRAFT_9594 [Corynascus sepedonium]
MGRGDARAMWGALPLDTTAAGLGTLINGPNIVPNHRCQRRKFERRCLETPRAEARLIPGRRERTARYNRYGVV